MKLSVHLNEQNVKQVKNFLTCCGKLGTVLLIEASTNKMCWRIINSAKSACMMISLQDCFFEQYILYKVNLMTASVLLKHLLAAFRTPKIKSLELEIVDHEILTIVVHSESGLMKRYQVACVEEEHLAASIDRNQLPTTITADAFQLHKVLNSFQNSLDEVSLVVRPQSKETQSNQHIRMASYNGTGKARKGKTLNTIINIDVKGGQLFKSSVLRSDDTMEATFNIKDFAVIVALCKVMHADVMLHMGTPGTPLLVEASNTGVGNGMDAIEAELLLATVAEYVQDDLVDVPPEAAGTPAPNDGVASNSPLNTIPTPGQSHEAVHHQAARHATISPPEYQQHYQPSQHQGPHPQHTQQHFPAAHAAPHPTPTAAHMQGHVQHQQPAHSGLVLDTHTAQGMQHQNGLATIPETTLGTAAPNLRGALADAACLATPPNFKMAAAAHAERNANEDATPAHLEPPALPHHAQQGTGMAATEPYQAANAQHNPPSVDAFHPSFRLQSQDLNGGANTQGMGGMHHDDAEPAQHDPLTLRLPGFAEHVSAQGGSSAQRKAGISSLSDLRGDTPGAGHASVSHAGRDFGVWPQQSQQITAGADGGGTQDPPVGMASLLGTGANVGRKVIGGVENRAPEHNHNTATTYTQNGSASKSLMRLAEIIKQDERARQAGGGAPERGAADQEQTISMRVVGEFDDKEQMIEDADGEFAADDWECLATPPEERPDTFFE